MTLILKPTELCNFSCSYCSSSNLVEDKAEKLPIEKVFQFLNRFPNTQYIFVVGGDPLMMPPKYYWDLLEYINQKNLSTKVGITSNLWDFYKHPDKWVDLFKQPNFEVGTSFQYGLDRRINKKMILTEEIFIDIFNKFKELVGTPLYFLSVIDDSNEHLAIKNVELAKRLGTCCSLTWSVASGRHNKPYLPAKMYAIYLEIYERGLHLYEKTIYELVKKVGGLEVSCPMTRSCGHWLRSLNPDGRYFFCGPLNDDLDKRAELDFDREVIRGEDLGDTAIHPDWQALKEMCWTCDMFNFCNGCRKKIKDTKEHGLVEAQCSKMLSIRDKILAISKIEQVVPYEK